MKKKKSKKVDAIAKYPISFKVLRNGRFVRQSTRWLTLSISKKAEQIYLSTYGGREQKSRERLPMYIMDLILGYRKELKPIYSNSKQRKRLTVDKEALEWWKKKFRGEAETQEYLKSRKSK